MSEAKRVARMGWEESWIQCFGGKTRGKEIAWQT